MPQFDSLDDLIAKKAFEYADQIKAAAAMADKEEEIRIESEKQLAFIQKAAGIKLEGKHEFTVASGRVDSVYSRVIIEYKNPKSPGDKIGPKGDSPGSKKVVDQIKKRFYDMRAEHGQPLNSLFGVGLDGNYFIFVRFRDEKWQVQEPVEVNHVSVERFLWALFNLGTKGKAFSPEYLAGDFGSEGGNTVAIKGIHTLYDAIVTSNNPKAQTFFSQWKILFGEVCGYDVDSQSEKLRKLAEFYQVGVKDPKPAELLFAVHTYYALFMKLLAAEIVAFFHKLPTPLQKMMQATTSNKLKAEMEDLEAGSIFRHLNITNFLEGDLFAWYTSVWTEPIEKLVREMVTRLDDYNPGTLSEDPTGSRDLLKKLYQQLFPKSVRHDLGEYYTPDWLAEHVLNEIGYAGDPDKRLLDPACGSGTFLVMAINRVRRWYDENRESCQFNESELGGKILANVIGFDLNPLAVMAARTNYLIAIRDLIGYLDKVEIPVYLCDSVMTPSEYGGLFAGGLGKARELKTAPATFIIPTEIATNREDVAKYAERLEFCVRNGYSASEFIQRCRDEGLPISEQRLHISLYDELVSLDKANKNGVWARIIKNAFAPLFIGKVDYVAGNPPWVNWRNLPPEYRTEMIPLWENYGLFSQKGLQARLGAGMDDISVLMTYVSSNAYLREGGRLGFVVTQTLFQSAGGGQGFRKFSLPSGKFINVERVYDFSSFQPFEGATNRTATIHLTVSAFPTIYPVEYVKVELRDTRALLETWDESPNGPFVMTKMDAAPIGSDKTSSWSVMPKGMAKSIENIRGVSNYVARIGAHSGGAAGVFWVDVVKRDKKYVLVSNRWDAGRNKYDPVTMSVETELVRPLVRGRDVQRWTVNPSLSIIIPYAATNFGKAISETKMKMEFPKAFEYFNTFKSPMLERPHYLQHFKPSGAPYWSMYNVGNYTFAHSRVVWREQTSSFQCAVIDSDPELAPVADAKLIVVACGSSDEAHYLAALLNSSPARFVINSYVVKVQISTHVLKNIAVPTFLADNPLHIALAEQSRLCHAAVRQGKIENLSKLEQENDLLAAKLWKLTLGELEQVQSCVSFTENDDAGSDDE
jgi:methylase of polypeptide subunit release factors